MARLIIFASGASMTNISKTDGKLYGALRRYFGSINRALAAACIDVVRPEIVYRGPRDVIDGIHRWYEQREMIPSVFEENRALGSAAWRYFNGWGAALEAAGIQPNQRRWSRELVIREIRARAKKGVVKRSIWRETHSLNTVGLSMKLQQSAT